MSQINLYKVAAKDNYLFLLPGVGQLTVSDLFQLDLPELDEVAKATNALLKESAEESFVKATTTENTRYRRMLELVKDVIADKQSAIAEAAAKVEKKARRKVILEAIARKQNEAIDNMTLEQLQAELED